MPPSRRQGQGITAAEINNPGGLNQRGFAYKSPQAKKLSLRSLDDLDSHNKVAKEAKRWHARMMQELGGYEAVSLQRRTLLERAAFLRALCGHMEFLAASGEEIDLGSYNSLVSGLTNVLRTVGLERVMRDVTPDLSRYIAQHAATNGDVSNGPGTGSNEPGGGGREAATRRHDASYENGALSSDDEQLDEPSKAGRHAAMDEFYRRTHPHATINSTAHRDDDD